MGKNIKTKEKMPQSELSEYKQVDWKQNLKLSEWWMKRMWIQLFSCLKVKRVYPPIYLYCS